MKRSDILFTGLLVPLDYIVLVGSFLLAYYIRSQSPALIPTFLLGGFADALHYTPELQLLRYQEYLPFILILSFVSVIIFALTGLYKIQRFVTPAQSSARVIRAVGQAFLILLIVGFIYGSTVLPRLVLIYAVAISAIMMLIARGIIALVKYILQRVGFGVVRVCVLGDSNNSNRVVKFVGKNKRDGYILLNQYRENEIEKLQKDIAKRKFDELIVADNQISESDLIELRERCIEKRIGFMFVPSVLEVMTSNVVVRDIKGYPLIEVPVTPLEGWGTLFKRIADIICSSILLVLLSPVYLILALIIYLDSPGPVIFKHKRLGQDLKTFNLFKFRTMRAEFCDGEGYDAARARKVFKQLLEDNPKLKKEWDEYHKLKDDPRVTRVGHLLRKLSLDEFPQFFNVFLGNLSLVGPRPIVKDELEKYGRYQHRLSTIRPGVTGLWQVSGRNDTTYEERIRLDMVYVETWSVWLDIVILIKTALVLILRRGAY